MLLSLGDFQFSVATAAYNDLDTKASYPWATVDRLQNVPQRQAMGKETRSVTLKGTVYTSYRGAGSSQIETIRGQAARMSPLPLVTGSGRFLGLWVVTKIDQGDSYFFEDGTPQKQVFTITLDKFD